MEVIKVATSNNPTRSKPFPCSLSTASEVVEEEEERDGEGGGSRRGIGDVGTKEKRHRRERNMDHTHAGLDEIARDALGTFSSEFTQVEAGWEQKV